MADTNKIPPYPRHLTPAERQAVAEKAARDLTEGSPLKGDAALLMGMLAEVMVAVVWSKHRIDALEAGKPEGGE